jgi:hypothetical protein
MNIDFTETVVRGCGLVDEGGLGMDPVRVPVDIRNCGHSWTDEHV